MLHKQSSLPVKDVDEKGVVSIYINSFDREDSDNDVSDQTSFNKTIKENKNRVRHFLNHKNHELLGFPREFVPDTFGLLTHSQLNMKKQIALDTYEDYKLAAEMGTSLEHSFGFDVIKRDEKDKRIIKEYKLWEYSTLTHWGANQWTPLVDIKSLDDAFEPLLNRLKHLNKHLKDGKASDEFMVKCEQEYTALLDLHKQFLQLKTTQPATSTEPESDLDLLIKTIKQKHNIS